MIKHIEDLKCYLLDKTNEFERKFGEDETFTKSNAIYKAGISDTQLTHLHEFLPELPENYTECLKKYNIFGVAVGYFSISPINWDSDSTVDSLIKAQSVEESFLSRAILDPLDFYWIGNNNDYTVYVAGKNSPCYLEGEIIAIHEFIFNAAVKDYESYRLLLAKDFEQFLVIAGNLNEVHRLNCESDSGKAEMLQRLKALNVDEKYHDGWMEYL
jgi:hypothetical protein